MHYNFFNKTCETYPDMSEVDYHKEWRPTIENHKGPMFLSSSRVKGFINGQAPKGQAKAQEMGSNAHKYLEMAIKGQPFSILGPFVKDGKALKKGSGDYLKEWEKLEKVRGKGTFVVLNNTDYADIKNFVVGAKDVVAKYADEGALQGEVSFFVGWDKIKDYQPLTESTKKIHEFFVATFPNHGIKARPDLMIYKYDGTIKLVDWKKTAKASPVDIYRQKNQLMYDFSLHFYALAVEIVTGTVVSEFDLVMMSSKTTTGPYILRADPKLNIKQFDFKQLQSDALTGRAIENTLEKDKMVILPNNGGRANDGGKV